MEAQGSTGATRYTHLKFACTALLSAVPRTPPPRRKGCSGDGTLPQIPSPEYVRAPGARRNGVHVERCRRCFTRASCASGLVARRRICPAGFFQFGGVVRFAIPDVGQIPAALVLLCRRPPAGLDQRPIGFHDRPFVRDHLSDAGLAGSPSGPRPSLPPLLLGL